MNWKAWLQGLAAAAVTAAASGATQVITTTGKVTTGTAVLGGVSGLVGALLYLMQSPLGKTPAAPPKQ